MCVVTTHMRFLSDEIYVLTRVLELQQQVANIWESPIALFREQNIGNHNNEGRPLTTITVGSQGH